MVPGERTGDPLELPGSGLVLTAVVGAGVVGSCEGPVVLAGKLPVLLAGATAVAFALGGETGREISGVGPRSSEVQIRRKMGALSAL